jgi:predicted porin
MKKSLLALAVLGAFAGAASAQSSVTIYGVIDMGIQKSNGGNTYSPGVCEVSAATCGPLGTKAWTLVQSTASRLGFRGNEDLGGGLSAQFQIEHRFAPDTGAQSGGVMWNGRSYVQLTSTAAGSVYLGREYAPWFWLAAKSDPFGLDGVGQFTGMLYGLVGGHETGIDDNGFPTNNPASRQSNAVGYKSPNLGGLTFNGAVGLGEHSQNRDASFNVEYTAGPIYAGVGFDKKSGFINSTDGNSLINIAAAYDFGVAKLMGYYARAKAGVNSDATHKVFTIGATAPVGPGLLKVGIGKVDAEGDNSRYDVKKFSVGYNYNLSKRTNLYADFSTARDDADFVTVSGNPVASKNSTAYAFGLRHTF